MNILVRLPNWLGDMVMSIPFLNALHQEYPEAKISVIAKAELAVLAEKFPHVEKVIPFPKNQYKGIRGVYQFGKTLTAEKFTHFFCLPDSFSSGLMGYATKAAQRIGFKKEGRSILFHRTFRKPAHKHRTA